MTEGIAIALILFVIAGIFFGLAWWIKSSIDRKDSDAMLFKAFALIFAMIAVAALVMDKPGLS